jgi:hypothetical protein
MAVTHPRPLMAKKENAFWPLSWMIAFCILVLMIGFRDQVGADWDAYLGHIEAVDPDILITIANGDPAYSALNWLASKWGGIYLTNFIAAVFFSYGLVKFSRINLYPWLALVIAVPYLVIVVAMGYNRQGLAIGMVMLGLAAWHNGVKYKFIFWVLMAALCHKSAIILLPLAALASTKRKTLTLIYVGIITALFYLLFLVETVDVWNANYIQAEYQSRGALVRLLMNAIPAVLFMIFRRKFKLPDDQRNLWTSISLFAVGLLVALPFSPSSTAIDRIALYCIPLQIFILANLPLILNEYLSRKSYLIIMITIYSGLLLFVWIYYGDYSEYWIPYQFYPWVWLSQ